MSQNPPSPPPRPWRHIWTTPYLTTKDEEKAVWEGHDEGQVAEEDVEVGPRDGREHVDVDGDGGGGKHFNLSQKFVDHKIKVKINKWHKVSFELFTRLATSLLL